MCRRGRERERERGEREGSLETEIEIEGDLVIDGLECLPPALNALATASRPRRRLCPPSCQAIMPMLMYEPCFQVLRRMVTTFVL